MVKCEKDVLSSVKKGKIPQNIFKHFHNVFLSIDLTKDLTIFDIKKLKGSELRNYYRLRKGKFRGIFFIEKNNIFVIKIDKREDVYK